MLHFIGQFCELICISFVMTVMYASPVIILWGVSYLIIPEDKG